MNRFEKFALVEVIVTTLLCARMTINAADAYNYLRPLSRTMWMIGVAGWVIATWGPFAIAVWFWRWAKRARSPLVLHVLFLPCAVIMLRTGTSLMLFVIDNPDFDATLGGPEITADLLFVIAVCAYFGALLFSQIRKSSNRA